MGEFELKGLPRMTNSIGRSHWTVKHRESVKWQNMVVTQCQKLGIENLGLGSAVLTLTRFSSTEPDFDGLVSGFKHVLDGLVVCGVIINDKPSVIGQPKYFWEYSPRKQGGKISVKIETLK